MMIIANEAMVGANSMRGFALLPKVFLVNMPRIRGDKTVSKMVCIMGQKGMGKYAPPSNSTNNGVSAGDKKVAMVVSVTEKATAPPARKTITLLAIAPGAQPTIITPSASSGGKPASHAAAAPSKGIMLYWLSTPTKMGFGIFKVVFNSSGFNTTPKANIDAANSHKK